MTATSASFRGALRPALGCRRKSSVMAGLFRVYTRGLCSFNADAGLQSICPETPAWSKIAARAAFTGAEAAEAAALPGRAARSFRCRTEWSLSTGNRYDEDWQGETSG